MNGVFILALQFCILLNLKQILFSFLLLGFTTPNYRKKRPTLFQAGNVTLTYKELVSTGYDAQQPDKDKLIGIF